MTMPALHTALLAPDTHAEQAERVADHCEAHPGRWFTAPELGAACDLGCASKVLSFMAARDGPGYAVAKDWRRVIVADGKHSRRVRVYRVTARPRGHQLALPGIE